MADEKKIIEIQVQLNDGIKEIGRLVGMIDELSKAQKGNKRATEEQRTEYAANSVAIREYRAQLATMVRETRNEIKSTNEKLGYIQQLKAQVSNLTLEYERLSQAELQGSKGGEVLTLLKNKRDELSKLEQAYGNYGRNVGNYSSATNNLAINLGMVMKEVPNFAISARIGIMSLTNNLPMLAEAIKAVRVEQAQMIKEGKAVPSIFNLISKSIFGLTGIVSLAMVALQLFSAEIILRNI
jgi:chromosome segregation ATPase